MIIKVIAQRVQSLYSKGVQSDDSRLSTRHIYNTLLGFRSRLLIQKINKRQPVSQWVYQTLNCVELVKAKPYECPCLPPVGCTIMKTKYPLPQPLTGLMEGHMIQSVTSLDGSVIYSETTWEQKKYKKGSKYTADKPDFYIRDGYLFITTKKGPKAITITGLFQDPLEVYAYPSICGKEECVEEGPQVAANSDDPLIPPTICPECESPLNKDLPFENDMEGTLIEMTAKELIENFNRNREDISNNSRDNITEESK